MFIFLRSVLLRASLKSGFGFLRQQRHNCRYGKAFRRGILARGWLFEMVHFDWLIYSQFSLVSETYLFHVQRLGNILLLLRQERLLVTHNKISFIKNLL